MTGGQTAPITADWAWLSAEPGSGDAVGILATSDSPEKFRELTRMFPTGSPSSTTDPRAPAAPPWVTFGPVPIRSGATRLSVSVREPWEQPDLTKRPVSPRRFFLLCPFAELAEANASYQTIWEAMEPVRLPAEDRRPVRLPVQPQALTSLVLAINHYGFDRLALIAAVLLQARVAVTGASAFSRDERLAVIDAVAALLPYGFRADLSASSGVKETAEHEIRLVFAELTSSDDQVLLPLHGAEPQLRPGMALEYLTMLRDKEETSGLDSVVAHLWDYREEYTFRRPEDALDVLGKLAPVDYFVRMLCDENLTRGQVLTLFRQPETVVKSTWNHPDVPDSRRDRALDLLLADQDDQVTGLLRNYWETLVDSLTRFALRGLDQGDLMWAVWLLRVASEVPDEAEDDLLARLLATEQADRGEVRRNALAGLLLNRPAPPAQGAFRASCDELRGARGGTGHERLVHQMLVSQMSRSSGSPLAVQWAQWLCWTSLAERREGLEWPDWMLAIVCVLSGARGQVPFTTVSSLIRRTPAWAVVLRLAWQAGHLAEILGDIWSDLVEIAVWLMPRDGQAGRGAALADALGFDSSRLAGELAAIVDTILVLLGRPPGDFLIRGDQHALDGYGRGLTMVFDLPAVQPTWSLLERGLLDHAVQTKPLPAGAIWLMKNWAADLYRAPGLAQYIVASKMADTLLNYGQFDRAFWEEIVKHKPELRPFASGPILRETAEGTIERPGELRRARENNSVPTTELAYQMCEAFLSGMSVEGILRVLMHSNSADGKDLTSIKPEELDEVFRQFQGLLFYEQSKNFEDKSLDALFEFYKLISGGALGRDFGRKFARHVKKVLRDQIRARKKARRILSHGARGRFLVRRARGHGTRRQRRGAHDSHATFPEEGAGGAR